MKFPVTCLDNYLRNTLRRCKGKEEGNYPCRKTYYHLRRQVKYLYGTRHCSSYTAPVDMDWSAQRYHNYIYITSNK